MNKNKKYDAYLYAWAVVTSIALLLLFTKERIVAIILFVVAIVMLMLAERNHPVKIVKIKPKLKED